MTLLVAMLVVTILSILVCHTVAKKRGANPIFWAVMAAIFGPFAVPFVFLSKNKSSQEM